MSLRMILEQHDSRIDPKNWPSAKECKQLRANHGWRDIPAPPCRSAVVGRSEEPRRANSSTGLSFWSTRPGSNRRPPRWQGDLSADSAVKTLERAAGSCTERQRVARMATRGQPSSRPGSGPVTGANRTSRRSSTRLPRISDEYHQEGTVLGVPRRPRPQLLSWAIASSRLAAISASAERDGTRAQPSDGHTSRRHAHRG